jgi:kynurenine formamidase
MRRSKSGRWTVWGAVLVLMLGCTGSFSPGQGGAQAAPKVTPEMVEGWMSELSNWGRWGEQDELGTLNLITPAKRKQAAALVKSGISVSLARDVEKEKAADNDFPFEHVMDYTGLRPTGSFSVDTFKVRYHGYAHTHMDAICHMFHKGKMYNGYAQEEVVDEGARKLGVNTVKSGIFSRGILMGIPRLKGVPYLEAGTPIYPADLDAWEKKAGLKVTSGDVLFIRTGRWLARDEKGPWNADQEAAGIYASCARWIKDRDIAMMGSDAALDVRPSGVEGNTHPIHQLVLIAMGTPIFDNCDLEAVAEEAARQNRWEFLLTAAPLAVPGATGSPLNPIATF